MHQLLLFGGHITYSVGSMHFIYCITLPHAISKALTANCIIIDHCVGNSATILEYFKIKNTHQYTSVTGSTDDREVLHHSCSPRLGNDWGITNNCVGVI